MNTVLSRLMLAALFAGLAACGQDASDTAAPEPEAAATGTPESPQALPRTASPEGARVFIITPADGATVTSPVSVEFGIEGMTVVRAGVAEDASGHHHLIVNADLPPLGMPIPANENYIHFGDASTSTSLELPPGEHTLTLLLGDHLHFPHDPPVASEPITITVLETAE